MNGILRQLWGKRTLIDPPAGTVLAPGQKAYDSVHRVTVEGPGIIGELTPSNILIPPFYDAGLTIKGRPLFPLRFGAAATQIAGREIWLLGKWIYTKRADKVQVSVATEVAGSYIIVGIYKCNSDGTCGDRISRSTIDTTATGIRSGAINDFIYPGQTVWASIWCSHAIAAYNNGVTGQFKTFIPNGAIFNGGINSYVRESIASGDAAPTSFPGSLTPANGSIPTLILEPE